MNKLHLLLVLLAPLTLQAATDYQCVSDCTAKNYQYSYCTSKCSFDDGSSRLYESQNNNQIKQTDYACVSDCTAKGYMYNFCTDKCSF